MMYQIFEVTTNIDGEKRREHVLLTWRDGGDPYQVLHKLGLEYALSPDNIKKYRYTGLPYNEIFSHLTPEMLAPHDMQIVWLDREALPVDGKQIVNRYELESHVETMERDSKREKKMREIAERYANRLERLKAEGHPLLSEWDAGRVSARAISWAYQFVRAGGLDTSGFFNARLADAMRKAGLSPEAVGGDRQENIPQSA